jgi:small subunit ribosomal protein S20
MANHKSSIKRIKRNDAMRLHNKYYARSTRSAVRKMRATKDKAEATEMLPKVTAMLDKLAKRNLIHSNKADRLKSQMTRHVASL